MSGQLASLLFGTTLLFAMDQFPGGPPGGAMSASSKRADCSVPLSIRDRMDCGYPSISNSSCQARGCCFDNSIRGTNFCHRSVCMVRPSRRVDCGFSGIRASECRNRGCCFDNSIRGTKWCFYRASCAVNPTDRRDCGFPGISQSWCTFYGCCFDRFRNDEKFCFYPRFDRN